MASIKAQNTRFFNPTAVAGCQVWFDGADPLGTGIPPANSASISTWTDKSGNNYNATPSSGRIAGTFSSASNCVYFGSSSVGYQTSYSANPTNETLFFVANINSPANGNNNIIIGGQYGARSFGFGYTGAGGTGSSGSSYLTNQVVWQSSSVAGPSPGVTSLITGTVTTTTNVAVALNGSSLTTGTLTAWSAGTTTYLGVDTTNTGIYYVGFIMEILFYNSVLSDTQRRQIEAYLAYKWGLNSKLPTSHPYYSIPFFAEAVYFPQALIKTTGTNLKHPAAIAGLSLWFDAQDIYGTGQSFPIGGIVRQWIDKSPFSNSTSNYSGSPLYSGAGINQYPAIYFKSSNSPPPMYFLGGLSQTFSGTQMNCFAVATIGSNIGALSNAYSAYGRILGLARPLANDFGDPTTTFPFIQDNATQAVIIGRNSSYLSTPIPGYNTPFLVQSSHNGAMEYIGVNGNLTPASLNTGITGSFNITSYGVGVNPNTGDVGSQFTGYIGEVLAFLGVTLTTPQVQSVESYLAWKWGLQTSLATGHPYKTSPFMSPPYRNPIVRNNYTTRVDPRLFGGCQFWLDASDRGTISYSGSSVTSIREKAQNIVMTAQGTASFLTTPPTSIGSQQSLLFDNPTNANVYLSGTFQSILTGCIFIVWKNLTQSGANYYPIFTWNSGSTYPAYGQIGGAALGTYGPYTAYGGSGTPTFVATANTNYLTFYSWSGTIPTVGLNGATPTSGSQPAFSGSTTTFWIGADSTGGAQRANMYLGELIIFNSVLGQTQRQQIEGYLAWKWGLKNSLPTTHPYYNFPPSP